jgi:intein-encoded DNA endonuclease-like protein
MIKKLGVGVLFLMVSTVVFAQSEDGVELKTKDMNQQPVNSMQTAQGGANATISPEQIAELQKQMADLKKKQEEANKMMEDLDKE